MSKFVPSDTELIPTPIYYKSLYIGLPDDDIDTPQVYYDNIDLAEENYHELETWGLFLNNHLGRGIQSYLRQPNGKITYPPRFLQGTFLMVLSKEIIKEISTYDLKKSSMVGILDPAIASRNATLVWVNPPGFIINPYMSASASSVILSMS